MAAFIDQVSDSVPIERFATRDHLKSIQAVFFVGDYVMAAKTNHSLTLSKLAIVAAFTNVAQDTSYIRGRLRFWAERPGTLTDHYQSISEISPELENIKAIKTALAGNGVVIDTESDLLMDCIRYAVHNTCIYEMYGSNPMRIEETTALPLELNALVSTGNTIFQHRFAGKFGLSRDTVASLMDQLKQARLHKLSPAGVEIPVMYFQ